MITSLNHPIVTVRKNLVRQNAMQRKPGSVRIISGRWRGRRVRLTDNQQLRPTGDRIRETLFNWLGAQLAGWCCLDLFAGTGILGLEALSRGADQVTFVEKDQQLAQTLKTLTSTLDATHSTVLHAEAERLLNARATAQYDMVFLDPPFSSPLMSTCCELLERNSWLSADAWLYLETRAKDCLPRLPANWRIIRDKRAGAVRYYLVERMSGPT